MIVEKKVILELKSVEKVTADSDLPSPHPASVGLGYLLNFGEALMKHGITRAVSNLEE